MKKGILILLALCFHISSIIASNNEDLVLSDSAKISLITCGPGQELYVAFGHSAVRVSDPHNNVDIVFNYGTFSFNTSFFYVKFAQGKLNYMLSASYYQQFIDAYAEEGRFVHEQELRLTKEQRQVMCDFLMNNYKPENRYYKYDFFFDNCATRVRDILEKCFPGQLIWETAVSDPNQTFRQLVRSRLNGMAWGRVGINLALGQLMDAKPSAWQYQFLPDYMSYYFGTAKWKTGQSLTLPISETKSQTAPAPQDFALSPNLVFWGLFVIVLVLSALEWRRKKPFSLLDLSILYFLGFLGILLVLLWTATDHKLTVYNWNLLWANPLNFIAALAISRRWWPRYITSYFVFLTGLGILTLLLWPLLPQQLDTAFIPFVGIIVLRGLVRLGIR